jgi:hypothetical protein
MQKISNKKNEDMIITMSGEKLLVMSTASVIFILFLTNVFKSEDFRKIKDFLSSQLSRPLSRRVGLFFLPNMIQQIREVMDPIQII